MYCPRNNKYRSTVGGNMDQKYRLSTIVCVPGVAHTFKMSIESHEMTPKSKNKRKNIIKNQYLKGNLLWWEPTCYHGLTESRKGQKAFCFCFEKRLLFSYMTAKCRPNHVFNVRVDLKWPEAQRSNNNHNHNTKTIHLCTTNVLVSICISLIMLNNVKF